MKSLIERLQEQAGLTKMQANNAMNVFRDFLIENSYDPDLTEDVKLKAMAQYDRFSEKVDKLTDKIENKADELSEKADEWIHKARKEAKKAADKLSDYLDDKK